MDSQTPKRTRYISLQAKLAFGFSLLAILSSGIITGVMIYRVRERILQDVRDHLRDAVSIGALQVDGDSHATLNNRAQEEGEPYLTLKRVLQKIRDAGTNFTFVYSLRSIDGKVYFIVDAEESPEDVSHLMDFYADLPEDTATLIPTMDEPYVQEAFYEDEWGVWLTGYAPIRKSDGTVDGVLAIDIDSSDVIAYQNSMIGNTLLIYLVTVPIVGLIGWFLGRQLARPIMVIIEGARRMEAGDLNTRVQVNTQDETADLAEAFNAMAAQLSELVGGLEQLVVERTMEVEKHSAYLKAAADVSRDATTILEPDGLIPRIVDLIRDNFKLYYVGLFLVDESNEWAVLRSGTGEAGRIMVERGHRIKIGEGMIGWCIEHAQARVALEAKQDAVRLVSPLLPETRSEAALPLRSRGRVFGALTVQSNQPGVFDEATISVLQTMADQVSVALDNARLFTESEKALKTLQRSVSEYRRQAWQDTFQTRQVMGYRGDVHGLRPLESGVDDLDDNGHKQGSSESPQGYRLQIPIKIREQVLGVIEACKPLASGEWTQEEITLMSLLIDQLGVALDNARLYEESLQRAERERILAEITSRVRASANINEILQTAVSELSEALHVPVGAIRLLRSSSGNPPLTTAPRPETRDSGNGGPSND